MNKRLAENHQRGAGNRRDAGFIEIRSIIFSDLGWRTVGRATVQQRADASWANEQSLYRDFLLSLVCSRTFVCARWIAQSSPDDAQQPARWRRAILAGGSTQPTRPPPDPRNFSAIRRGRTSAAAEPPAQQNPPVSNAPPPSQAGSSPVPPPYQPNDTIFLRLTIKPGSS